MKTDVEKDGLLGSVKAILIESVQLIHEGDEYAEKPQSATRTVYNPEGNRIETSIYSPSKGLVNQVSFARNGVGSVIKEAAYQTSVPPTIRNGLEDRMSAQEAGYDNSSLRWKTLYAYDSHGKLIEKSSYKADGALVSRTIITYNNEGKASTEEVLLTDNGTGGLGFYVITAKGQKIDVSTEGAHSLKQVFDPDGNPVELIFYGEDGASNQKFIFSYDAEGKIAKVDQYVNSLSSNGNHAGANRVLIKLYLLFKCIYSYISRGKLFKAIRCLIDKAPLSERIYIYNTEGRIAEEQLHFSGSLERRKVYLYDSAGNITEEAEYDSSETLCQKQNYTREFDPIGNWIKETAAYTIMLPNKADTVIANTVVRRTIIYY